MCVWARSLVRIRPLVAAAVTAAALPYLIPTTQSICVLNTLIFMVLGKDKYSQYDWSARESSRQILRLKEKEMIDKGTFLSEKRLLSEKITLETLKCQINFT